MLCGGSLRENVFLMHLDYCDPFPGFLGIPPRAEQTLSPVHVRVNNEVGEYIESGVRTNGISSFFPSSFLSSSISLSLSRKELYTEMQRL